jgi:hypothetical protein
VWQEVWKRWIRSEEVERGEGRGCRFGWAGPMLNASLGSPCCERLVYNLLKVIGLRGATFWPSGSRDSPAIFTQPRLMPPALDEWIAYSALCSSDELKNSLDYILSV